MTNFSQRIDPMLLQEIFQIAFSNNNYYSYKKIFIKIIITAGGMPETQTLRKQVVVEYLNVWFG